MVAGEQNGSHASGKPQAADQVSVCLNDSLRRILADAKAGDAAAGNEVGIWYYEGENVPQDYKEAVQWWIRAAKQKNPEAIGNLGLCYQAGNGVAPDSVKAGELYLASLKLGNKALFSQQLAEAQKGSLFSSLIIANCYQHGYSVDKDPLLAIPYLRKGAEASDLSSIENLAMILINANKKVEALKWFREGARLNSTLCNYYAGYLLTSADGVKREPEAGVSYLVRAADAGYPMAMYRLGECYLKGIGVTESPEMAVKWFYKAASHGVSHAQYALARCFRLGIGVTKNYERSVRWYAEAYARGYRKAFRDLVVDSIPGSPFVTYLDGLKSYAAADYKVALDKFKQLDKEGISEGKLMTAIIYGDKDYPKSNPKRYFSNLEDAAKLGNPRAMYLLGLFYAADGKKRNPVLAREYLQKSADAGYGPAECGLADMYYEGRGVTQDYGEAVKWYITALEHGNLSENCAERLKICYERELGGLVNDEKAVSELPKRSATDFTPSMIKEYPNFPSLNRN